MCCRPAAVTPGEGVDFWHDAGAECGWSRRRRRDRVSVSVWGYMHMHTHTLYRHEEGGVAAVVHDRPRVPRVPVDQLALRRVGVQLLVLVAVPVAPPAPSTASALRKSSEDSSTAGESWCKPKRLRRLQQVWCAQSW